MEQPLETILIIGGGLGGLALAQALRHSSVSKITLFERDHSTDTRQQGFIIGINKEGEKALMALKVSPLTMFITSSSSSRRWRSFKMTDDKFDKLMQFPCGAKGEGFMADRCQIRDLLMHDIPSKDGRITIEWGKRFTKYEEKVIKTKEGEREKVIAYFDDGTTAEGDLLVGADGSRSRLTAERYEKLPIANIGAFVKAPPLPNLQKLQDSILSCLIRALGIDGVSLLAMPYTSPEDKFDYIVWALTFPCKESDLPDDSKLKEFLKEKAAKINSEAVELVEMTPIDNFLPHRFVATKKPLGETTRVTLLGDAAHAMTSHAGLGANTAFMDAVDLANVFLSTNNNNNNNSNNNITNNNNNNNNNVSLNHNWRTALSSYEDTLITRGFKHVQISLSNTTNMTTVSSAFGAKARNFGMWLVGKFIGGETKPNV